MSRHYLGLAASAALLCLTPYGIAYNSGAFGATAIPDYVQRAVDDPARPVWDRARDGAKKPADVIAFSGAKPGQVIVDLVPGQGYYTRILSMLAGPQGKVFGYVPLPAGQRDGEMVRQHEAEARAAGKQPLHNAVDDVLAIQNVARYKNFTTLWVQLGAYGGQFALPEQVDTVLTVDAYHDMQNETYGKLDLTAFAKAMFRAMKPGAVYTVIDHAAAKGAGLAAAKNLRRSDSDEVKKEILAAGFVLDGESNVLANATDDHAKAAIDPAQHDNTDEYMLRFKKPATASNETLRPKVDPLKGYYGNTEIGNVDAKGTVSGNRPRWDLYNADGTYEEMGMTNPLQEGTWYWDAGGHNCEIHQFPATQRQFVVCHVIEAHVVGDSWVSGKNPDGSAHRNVMQKGYVYPAPPNPEEVDKGY